MRDPERQARIVAKLQQVWESKHPDIRLCQLLDNIVRAHSTTWKSDLFYVEDEALERWLDAEIAQTKSATIEH